MKTRPPFFFLPLLLIVGLMLLTVPHLQAGWRWANDMAEARVTPDEYIAVFTFQNTGLDPLTVDRIESSCNCTIHSFKADSVKTGMSGSLTITLDRRKSKTSKKVFEFMVTSPGALPAKLIIQVP